jgi:hypothetical protein
MLSAFQTPTYRVRSHKAIVHRRPILWQHAVGTKSVETVEPWDARVPIRPPVISEDRGFLEDQGHFVQGRSPNRSDFGGNARRGDFADECSRDTYGPFVHCEHGTWGSIVTTNAV